jgi:acyl-coenzyme A synthetase/AMP-(fatty) acid ligase
VVRRAARGRGGHDVNILLAAEEMALVVADAQPAAVLVGDVDLGFEPPVPVIPVDVWASTDVVSRAAGVDDGAPAVLAYTSGTTGAPKGVLHTHDRLLRHIALLRSIGSFDAAAFTYVATPLFAMHGFLSQVAVTLAAGGAVIVDD